MVLIPWYSEENPERLLQNPSQRKVLQMADFNSLDMAVKTADNRPQSSLWAGLSEELVKVSKPTAREHKSWEKYSN